MATAAGIIVTAGSITLLNEALNASYVPSDASNITVGKVFNAINWRVIPATVVASIFFAGLEGLNPTLAKGLAGVALLTTLIHPFGNGPSPLVHLAQVMGYGSNATTQGSAFNAPIPVVTGPIAV